MLPTSLPSCAMLAGGSAACPRATGCGLRVGEGVRSSAFRSYTIFFVVERDEVLIVRILHGARDITADDLEEEQGNA
jgi:plasmid stabilization system protein ParE